MSVQLCQYHARRGRPTGFTSINADRGTNSEGITLIIICEKGRLYSAQKHLQVNKSEHFLTSHKILQNQCNWQYGYIIIRKKLV